MGPPGGRGMGRGHAPERRGPLGRGGSVEGEGRGAGRPTQSCACLCLVGSSSCDYKSNNVLIV